MRGEEKVVGERLAPIDVVCTEDSSFELREKSRQTQREADIFVRSDGRDSDWILDLFECLNNSLNW